MLKEDFVIQSNIRRILTRSSIDYSGITFGTVKGVVYLRGIFKLAGFYANEGSENAVEFMTKNLRSLEKKIKGVPGVNDIVFEFTNWKKEKGQWIANKMEKDS